jgi:hypothetical protein
MEAINGKMVKDTLENGQTIFDMEKVQSNIQMELKEKVIGSMIKKLASKMYRRPKYIIREYHKKYSIVDDFSYCHKNKIIDFIVIKSQCNPS